MGPEPRVVAPGVWGFRISDPLYSSNVYLMEGPPLTLVDAGPLSAVSAGYLENGLHALGYSLGDVVQVIYTHHHLDHIGGGFGLAKVTEATHSAHHELAELMGNLDFSEWYATLGKTPFLVGEQYPFLIDIVTSEQILGFYSEMFPQIGPGRFRMTGLRDHETIDLKDRQLEVITVPGHSPYHIVLVDRANELLFGGDFLLSFTPPFSYPNGDNVGDFLESLDKFECLRTGVRRVLPGHGGIIEGEVGALVSAVRRRVLKRNDRITEYLRSNGSKTILEIFDHLFPEQRGLQRTWFSAFVTVLTHLRYLEKTGLTVDRNSGRCSL